MCGFTGIVGPFPDRLVAVERMTAAIVHRGPDDDGTYADEHCALGHRRLSIIDLSPAGRQPMTNEDGTVQVAFNGEIYNFQELRADLIARGHRFRSRTDTEVLVHLYEERGDAMLAALRGMFAFAVWDQRRRRLLLARDHFGQKPLFYASVGDALVFGSEIKALRAVGVGARPDPIAIDHLFRAQVVPAPYTCFAEIRRLPAATSLVREADGTLVERRYWSLASTPPRRLRLAEAVEEADALCRAAVTEQLVADVPVGVFVSGGIDSTIVLDASQAGGRPQSFTLGYDEAAYSEVDAARRATVGRDTDHHVIMMRANDAADPERLVEIFDEPFPDIAALPLAHLARHARPHVKVALTGDGGDELFGGYQHHIVGYWLARLAAGDRLRVVGAKAMLATAGRLGRRGDRVRRVFGPLSAPTWQQAVAAMRMPVSASLRTVLYTDELLRATAASTPEAALVGDGEGLAALFCPSGDRFLADRLLMKTDLAAMAVGLETRAPLLDLRLAELAASLPPSLKVVGADGKIVLRRVLARSASAAVWKRRKMGFTMPLDQWLKTELGELVRSTLLAPDARVSAYLRPDVLARMYREHVDGTANWRRILWTALLVELWLRRIAW